MVAPAPAVFSTRRRVPPSTVSSAWAIAAAIRAAARSRSPSVAAPGWSRRRPTPSAVERSSSFARPPRARLAFSSSELAVFEHVGGMGHDVLPARSPPLERRLEARDPLGLHRDPVAIVLRDGREDLECGHAAVAGPERSLVDAAVVDRVGAEYAGHRWAPRIARNHRTEDQVEGQEERSGERVEDDRRQDHERRTPVLKQPPRRRGPRQQQRGHEDRGEAELRRDDVEHVRSHQVSLLPALQHQPAGGARRLHPEPAVEDAGGAAVGTAAPGGAPEHARDGRIGHGQSYRFESVPPAHAPEPVARPFSAAARSPRSSRSRRCAPSHAASGSRAESSAPAPADSPGPRPYCPPGPAPAPG